MKIRFLPTLVLASMLSLASCVKGDIDDLQNQLDDLNSKVDDLEASQQEALLKAIGELENRLSALNSELVADLELLEEEIANNADAVFYGNVLTDDHYAALAAQGATIVTGKVVATKDAHYQALSQVKLIGGNMEINGGNTIVLEALQSIGEQLVISGIAGTSGVQLPVLSSVGGDVQITNNAGLVSVEANELVLIGGGLNSEMNESIESLSFSKLDQVEALHINAFWSADPEYINIGHMTHLELSETNVKGDAILEYIGDVEQVSIGNVGGDFNSHHTKISAISLASTKIPGDFILEYNTRLTTLDVSNLKEIKGHLSIGYNDNGLFWSETEKTGLSVMPAFEALTYIGGDVNITGNTALTAMEAFNNVTQIESNTIFISTNGLDMDNVTIFNALTQTGATQYSSATINVNVNTNWFSGFAALPTALHVYLEVKQPAEAGGGIGPFAINGTARVDGFDQLVDLSTLTLRIEEVTEFNAFGALNNFKNYQTYLTLYLPSDESVGLCSMQPILEKVKNGDFDLSYNENRKAVFYTGWTEMDRDTAIDQLLNPCGI